MPRENNAAAAIDNAAIRLLEESGPAAVTMRRVAKAAGITPMAIYHYFPTREALLQHVTDAEFDRLNEFASKRGHHGSIRNKIIHIMDGYLDYAFARPKIFDYVFSHPREGARQFPEDFRARKSPTLNPIAAVIEKAVAQEQLNKDDVWEIAFECWALVHGYICLYRAGRISLDEPQFRALVHRALRRLLDGLQA